MITGHYQPNAATVSQARGIEKRNYFQLALYKHRVVKHARDILLLINVPLTGTVEMKSMNHLRQFSPGHLTV
jgi:hypothetical protein